MNKHMEHVFERLRHGVVPDRGLDTFAVGIEKNRGEMHRQLKLVSSGEGTCKFLRGGYGCGKTFMSRLTQLDAKAQNFATSFVVVSDNDFHLHKFDDLYRKVMQELSTNFCERAALNDILDRWIGRVEDSLIAAGADEEADNFDQLVAERLRENLHSASEGKVPQDMVRVLQTIFELKQEGNLLEAATLVSWLSGSSNIAASAKKRAQVKGEIASTEAMHYLRGIVEIIKAAGYAGLVIVVDEMETILRMNRNVRERSMNGLRQILDASDKFPGLLWVFTGTAEFFDSTRGVAGLAPLHDRIKFQSSGGFATPRQPQLELKPFHQERLVEVALKLRESFPASDPTVIARKVTSEVIERLAARVTEGFKGDVGVVPRQFLREFVNILDLVDTEPDYDPASAESLQIEPMNDEERRVLQGQPLYEPEPEDALGYQLVEF
jgi:hypothetical protein